MLRTRKSWREKLEKVQASKLVDIPPSMIKRFGPGRMLIPHPLDIDSLIRKTAKGKLITQSEIRRKLARDHGADVTCPITTGIFVRIVAEAAEEDLMSGKERITPYWRVIKEDGSLNGKLPGGGEAQAARLKDEGHRIVRDGKKRPRVLDFEKKLTRL